MLKKAHMEKFRREKKNPTPDVLEKRRNQLQSQDGDGGRVVSPRVQRQVRVIQRSSDGGVKGKFKELLKEQIAQGGRQFHLEQAARTREFREQNRMPSGVLGSDVPSLKEELREKRNGYLQKIKEGSDNDT